MKKINSILFSIFLCVACAGYCGAELVPVEGSDNYMDNGMDAGESINCAELEFIFARGSGAEYMNSDMWLKYESEMSRLAQRLGYSYHITDVAYPAVSIIDPPTNAIGAYISAGKYYEFGRSVQTGVDWLRDYYASVAQSCPDAQWVLTGYSQGSMVVTEAVKSFRYDKVAYIALFTDPQLFLPEGEGLFPDACSGKNLSEYRVYVPVCRTHIGRLKARRPYQYGELSGKYGLWCGRDDYICGSTNVPWAVSGHTKYVERIPQLTSILKKRLTARTSSRMASRSLDSGNDVEALLSLDEYYVHPGEDIVIDASDSYSYDTEIVNYEWDIDDGEWWSSGDVASITLNYAAEGVHKVRLRVTDMLDAIAETEALVWVTAGDLVFYELPTPTEISASIDGSEVVLKWETHPPSAYYMYLRINGYDLGYVDAEQWQVRVGDIDFSDTDTELSVAWSTGKMNLSDFAVISLADVVQSSDDPIIAPNTNVSFADGILPCFAMVVCAMVAKRIMWA